MKGFLVFLLLGCMLMSGYEAAEAAAKVIESKSADEKHDSAEKAISAAIEKTLKDHSEDEAEDENNDDEFKLDQGAVEKIAQKLAQEADENEDAFDLEETAPAKDASATHKAAWFGRRRRRWRFRVRRIVRTGTKAYCCLKKLWWCCAGKK